MNKVSQVIYDRIDNDLHHADDDIWRKSDSPFYLMQCSVNPAWVGYFKKKLLDELKVNPQGKTVLEVGCGYGYTKLYPFEKPLRDVRLLMIYEGTSEIQRIIVSGYVLIVY